MAAVAIPQATSLARLFLTKPISGGPFSFLPNNHRKPIFVFSLHTQSPITTLTTKIPKVEQQQRLSFTIDYLIDSCGLSPDCANLASRKLSLDSPERPDTVLNLLRDHGFTTAQISTLVKKRPVLLLANAQFVLLPKLRFFLSIGVSKSLLARTLASDPTILTRSLVNQLIPSYNFLKSVLETDEKIVAALRRTTWVFLEDHTKNLVPNIKYMSETGVPEKCIKLLLTHFPEAVMQKNHEFRAITEQAKEMGFNPKKSTFVLAIHALSGKGNKSIWDKCFEVYQRWGWSEDDIMCAFKKHPHCMMLSERKIDRTMEFLVKEMNLAPRSIAQCPVVLFFSLEKRIIPRCLVTKVLVSKGLVKEDWSLTSLLVPVEKVFLDKLVFKYEEECPELMDVYRSYTKL
ncbi:Transcription termination factor MTERF15 [Cardamine amara subsp. amara]|uniref:Transcription termination factor MTERF15 n=1 Tax=Cardamine amara subsp. amara TaxID=228776 RepID=A0ABD0ZQ66_CARAN